MRRAMSLTLAAALVALAAPACRGGPCDPKNWLPSDCDEGETCDAQQRRCVEETHCATSADCAGGYVCYSDHTCARNCNWGMFPFDYCVPGYTCDEHSFECVKD